MDGRQPCARPRAGPDDHRSGLHARPLALPLPRHVRPARRVSGAGKRATRDSSEGQPTQGQCKMRGPGADARPLLPSPRNLNGRRCPGPSFAFPDDEDDGHWHEEVDNSGGRIFTLCDGSTVRSEGGAATHKGARWLWRFGPARSAPPNRRLDGGNYGIGLACIYAAPSLWTMPCTFCAAHTPSVPVQTSEIFQQCT